MNQLAAALRRDKLLTAAFVLLATAHLLPLLLVRHLPMGDAPAHLAVVEIWRTPEGQGLMGQAYERRGGLPPYLTYYGALRVLGSVISLEAANKLLIVGYALVLPLSLAYLLAAFGRDRRLALLGFPLIYNVCFIHGFIANLIALPLLLGALGLLQRYLLTPSLRRELLLALLVAALYFTHLLAAVPFAIAGPIVFFAHVRRPRAIVRRSLFVWPTLAVAIGWTLRSSAGQGFSGPQRTPGLNMVVALDWLNNFLVGSVDEIVLLTMLGTLIACLLLPAGRPATSALPRGHWALGVSALALAALYFVTPGHLSRPWYHWATNVRLVLPALLLLLTLPQARLSGPRALLLAPLVGVMLFGAVVTAQGFRRFDATVRHLDRILPAIPANRRVLSLVYDETDGVHQGFPLRHLPLLYQVRSGGYMPYDFDMPMMPIGYRQPVTPAPFFKNPLDFRYAEHGRYYDYFLAIFRSAGEAPPTIAGATVDQVRLVKASGRFALYRNVGGRSRR
ncbi:MAG: hypothetical protein IPL40_13965 [Proteobacteria bacterium]|nr:hypothetical protein [Pseudomonadota bacterium]